MGNIGTWASPLPLRLGGGGDRLILDFYAMMQSNRPDILQGKAGTDVDIENRMAARMLAMGWNATAARVAQRDPTKLSTDRRPVTFPDGHVETISPLERWERIFGIRPAPGQSDSARRTAVAARVVGYTSTSFASVTQAMANIFGPWFVALAENHVADVDYPGRMPAGNVHASWPTPAGGFSAQYPGEVNATYPWRTGVAIISVQIAPPAATSQADIAAKVQQAIEVLDAILPAWMSATISQFPPGQTSGGFYAGISLVGLTAI